MKRIVFFLMLVGLVSACASSGGITVESVWGRDSPKTAMAGAVYMQIKNTGAQPDKLLSAKSDGCGTVELHESYQEANGMMGMRPVTGGFIPIPAGGTVELKVGGLHVMCINRKVDFTVGTKVPLTLMFEKAGEIKVVADIRAQ